MEQKDPHRQLKALDPASIRQQIGDHEARKVLEVISVTCTRWVMAPEKTRVADMLFANHTRDLLAGLLQLSAAPSQSQGKSSQVIEGSENNDDLARADSPAALFLWVQGLRKPNLSAADPEDLLLEFSSW